MNTNWTQLSHFDGAEPGVVFQAARIARGWSVAETGARCGYSGSTVSRWERRQRNWTIEDLTRVAKTLGVPGHLVGLAGNLSETPAGLMTRARGLRHDEAMKRRMLIAAGLSTVTATALGARAGAASGIERALFDTIETEPVGLRLLAGRVASAEVDLEAARLAELDRRLPGLLGAAESTWKAADGDDRVRAASLFSRTLAVTGQQQIRLSKESIAAVAIDRAARYAEFAGDAVAAAEAARAQSVVLRRAGSPVADQDMVVAAERLRAATGLATAQEAGMYARILASAAYTASGHDDRDAAAEYLAAARAAIEPWSSVPHMSSADLDVYSVSCDRVLGDHGAALYHAQKVDLAEVTTAHERGRLWQDVAIAGYGRGRIDVSIEAVNEIQEDTPQYMLHRPWARRLVGDLLRTRMGGSNPLLRGLATQLHLA